MCKISVCIATYNGGEYIQKQLLSIINQINNDDEIIVSDDNSTDNTLDVIRSINDNRIKIFKNRLRPGPVKNFENAISAATGDYIFLCDQDDIWERDKVSSTINLLNTYDLVISDCEIISKDGSVLHKSFFKVRNSKKGFWYNLYKNSYIGCCMAFRRDVCEYVLPFPNNIYMHDWWIGLLVELKGNVFFFDRPMIKYVRHGQNFSPTGELSSSYSFWIKFFNRFNIICNILLRVFSTFLFH